MGTPEEGEEGLLMDIITGRDGDVDNWKEVILIYSSALKQIGTKLEILNDEFQHVHSYNPIEHIKTRIKTPDSIVKKLKRWPCPGRAINRRFPIWWNTLMILRESA